MCFRERKRLERHRPRWKAKAFSAELPEDTISLLRKPLGCQNTSWLPLSEVSASILENGRASSGEFSADKRFVKCHVGSRVDASVAGSHLCFRAVETCGTSSFLAEAHIPYF